MVKIKNIQVLRGLAVLGVVCFHLFLVERKYSGFETILPSVFQLGMMGVDLFFIISGFVMVMITIGKFQMPQQAFKFLYQRAGRIYPLYWVYSILALTVFLIKPEWVNSSQGNQVNIFASFLLLPSEKLPLVQVAWTLIHEMYFYLVFFLIFMFLSEKLLVHAIFFWGACVILLNLYLQTDNPFFDLILHPLTIEFLAGCLLGVFYQKNKESHLTRPVLMIIAGIFFLVAIAGYFYYDNLTQTLPAGWWRVGLYGLPCLVIVYCFIYAEKDGHHPPAYLVEIGNASYSIYLSHLFTINVVGRLWAMVTVPGWLDNIAEIMLALFLVLLVGFLSYYYIERPLQKQVVSMV